MSTYRIGEEYIKNDDAGLTELLAEAYANKNRPLCVCRSPAIEMYIAKVAGKLVIKRMPNSGGQHSSACDSYEPPAELSGIGQVMGSAIVENPDEGQTTLKFDFSLTKVAGRSAPIPSGVETDSVKTDGNKLTLRGTLHYLWEEAGFNRWSPSMHGKRSWYIIRKYLLQAAGDKIAKGTNLADILYVPESFSVERKDEIALRRLAHLLKATVSAKGPRKLMLVIGEVKDIEESRYGYKIVFRHLPDCHFMMNEDLHTRMQRRFKADIELCNAVKDSKLIAIGTFSVSATGIPSLEELALMPVTENWIPFESVYSKIVIDSMTRSNRRFSKGLSYNLPSTRPLACLVASDTHPAPTAMYILAPDATEDYAKALQVLIDESQLANWLWRAGDPDMPELPPVGQAGDHPYQ